jgi:hypothetical protein
MLGNKFFVNIINHEMLILAPFTRNVYIEREREGYAYRILNTIHSCSNSINKKVIIFPTAISYRHTYTKGREEKHPCGGKLHNFKAIESSLRKIDLNFISNVSFEA